ncbi:hypothetical protein M408DRAFT_28526 [Serendipita vermifera MAFF 305830]|uniref:Uncharacterized protein n=1 Tax=Serendipita vermifera MAFF 305830 TaxID=933852 RepID=A0A0C2WZI3_SERVB|nr:hypothetical protein M408DRAFT_28526 [Serendipita vermifera MAFF 305830]
MPTGVVFQMDMREKGFVDKDTIGWRNPSRLDMVKCANGNCHEVASLLARSLPGRRAEKMIGCLWQMAGPVNRTGRGTRASHF